MTIKNKKLEKEISMEEIFSKKKVKILLKKINNNIKAIIESQNKAIEEFNSSKIKKTDKL